MFPHIDLRDWQPDGAHPGAQWSHAGAQLIVNALYFPEGDGVPLHVNQGLDVWLVVLSGEGWAEVDAERIDLHAGVCLFIPRGAERAIHAGEGGLLYASAHATRAPLMPGGP